MSIEIREIRRGDLASIAGLIREFAEYENLSRYCEVTEDRLAAALFGDRPVAEGLIVTDGETAAGYALFFPNFSSFRAQRGMYLDDIYVSERYRGRGIGRQILQRIARIAAMRGFERIDFLVQEDNAAAIGFYKGLGALTNPDERHYKFVDEAFAALQAEPSA